jgi:hypothetical protein
MTASSRLAAHRAAALSAIEPDDSEIPAPALPDEDEDQDTEPTSRTKDKPMTTDTTDQAAIDAARAEGFAEANKRSSEVLASEHYTGREALAQTLLGNDKLSSGEIIAALATAPKAAPAVAAGDDEENARASLREGLAAEQPAATSEADELAAAADAKATNYGWDDVHAEVREMRGR